MKPGVGATIVFALFSSPSRQQIFSDPKFNNGPWLHQLPSSFSAPFQPSRPSLLTAGTLSTPLPGPALPQRSPPLRPKWSGLCSDARQICSQNWKDSALNLQWGRLKLPTLRRSSRYFEIVSFWTRWIVRYSCPSPSEVAICRPSNPLGSRPDHSGREPEGTLGCHHLECTDKKHAHFGGMFINILFINTLLKQSLQSHLQYITGQTQMMPKWVFKILKIAHEI